jgi:hypothetical protein
LLRSQLIRFVLQIVVGKNGWCVGECRFCEARVLGTLGDNGSGLAFLLASYAFLL